VFLSLPNTLLISRINIAQCIKISYFEDDGDIYNAVTLIMLTENCEILEVLRNEFGVSLTSISWEAARDSTKVLNYYLEKHISVNTFLRNSSVPLQAAIESGSLERVQILHQRGKVNLAMPYPTDHGPNYAEFNGMPPLLHAVEIGSSPIVDYLLEAKVDCQSAGTYKKRNGITPVYLASELGHLDILKSLVHHGADCKSALTEGDDKGKTPLYAATNCRCQTSCEHLKIVEYLHSQDKKQKTSAGLFQQVQVQQLQLHP